MRLREKHGIWIEFCLLAALFAVSFIAAAWGALKGLLF